MCELIFTKYVKQVKYTCFILFIVVIVIDQLINIGLCY